MRWGAVCTASQTKAGQSYSEGLSSNTSSQVIHMKLHDECSEALVLCLALFPDSLSSGDWAAVPHPTGGKLGDACVRSHGSILFVGCQLLGGIVLEGGHDVACMANTTIKVWCMCLALCACCTLAGQAPQAGRPLLQSAMLPRHRKGAQRLGES